MKKLRIFLASPGDIQEERNIVSIVVEELQRTVGDILHVDIELIRWETHTFPDIGDDAQDVINREIGEFDILVGMMWKRFGTQTKRANSGTAEEFERAYKYYKTYNRPKIMFYFRTTPFYSKDLNELSQFGKVLRFRKKLEKLGAYFWEYNEPLEFERRVREHLTKQVRELARLEEKLVTPKLFISYARKDLQRVEPIYESLKVAGFAPWMDIKDMAPGQRWLSKLDDTILHADFFLIFFSKNTFGKGYFNTETEMILSSMDVRSPQTKRIILVRLEPVELSAKLAGFQYVDVFFPDDYHKLVSLIKMVWQERKF